MVFSINVVGLKEVVKLKNSICCLLSEQKGFREVGFSLGASMASEETGSGFFSTLKYYAVEESFHLCKGRVFISMKTLMASKDCISPWY